MPQARGRKYGDEGDEDEEEYYVKPQQRGSGGDHRGSLALGIIGTYLRPAG